MSLIPEVNEADYRLIIFLVSITHFPQRLLEVILQALAQFLDLQEHVGYVGATNASYLQVQSTCINFERQPPIDSAT